VKLLNDLLSTDYGFYSLIVIGVIVVTMIGLYVVVTKKMREIPK